MILELLLIWRYSVYVRFSGVWGKGVKCLFLVCLYGCKCFIFYLFLSACVVLVLCLFESFCVFVRARVLFIVCNALDFICLFTSLYVFVCVCMCILFIVRNVVNFICLFISLFVFVCLFCLLCEMLLISFVYS